MWLGCTRNSFTGMHIPMGDINRCAYCGQRRPAEEPESLRRNSDPDTSHESARYMVASGQLGKDQQLFYNTVIENPGIIAGEIDDKTGRNGLWRRSKEVFDRGLVVYGAPRTYAGSGRKQRSIWPAK